jgi:hypothetical protein
MLKYLRIAVTALSLTACVLLIALWVRSYRRGVTAWVQPTAARSVMFGSRWGRLTLCMEPGFARRFIRVTHSIDDESPPMDRKAFEFRRRYVVNDDGGLGWLRGYSRTVIFPHWFAVALVGVVAVAPWLRWRFSLRTLLIATTLVAVGLGTVVYFSG